MLWEKTNENNINSNDIREKFDAKNFSETEKMHLTSTLFVEILFMDSNFDTKYPVSELKVSLFKKKFE